MLTPLIKQSSMTVDNRKKPMHKLQKKLLKLAEHDDLSQYGLRKLGEKIGVDHPQKVKWHLHKLINDGYLYKDALGRIRPTSNETATRLARVPILGLANCGEPLAFADNATHDYLTVSANLLGSRKADALFAVQASGDSMNACNIDGQPIEDGDYVIVDSSVGIPDNGDVIVSSLEGLANIKKFIRDDHNHVVALVSESTKPRPPIVVSADDMDAYRIHGRVVSVVKSYA